MLLVSLVGEHAKGNQVVLDLLEGGDHRLLVIGGVAIELGQGFLPDAAPPSAIEERVRKARTERIDHARGTEDGLQRGIALIADGRGEGEVGIERGLGDADSLIAFRGAALGGGDVGPALQQLGGKPWRYERGLRVFRQR